MPGRGTPAKDHGAMIADPASTPLGFAQAPPRHIDVDGIERRACGRALSCWIKLAGPRRFPSRSQVTPASTDDLWDHLFLIRVDDATGEHPDHGPGSTPDQAPGHVIELAGSVLQSALGADPTGRRVAEALPGAIRLHALKAQGMAISLRMPIDDSGRWVRADGCEVLYRSAFLPLSDDQRRVNYLLGAFSFRTVR